MSALAEAPSVGESEPGSDPAASGGPAPADAAPAAAVPAAEPDTDQPEQLADAPGPSPEPSDPAEESPRPPEPDVPARSQRLGDKAEELAAMVAAWEADAASTSAGGQRRQPASFPPLPNPPRTRILTMANQKGGVGKTTSAVNIAAALALSGLSVLVIDLDPQGNASTALGVDHHEGSPGVYDVLIGGRPLAEIVQECPVISGLSVAPATIDLAGAEIELVSMVARETRLRNALNDYTQYRERSGERKLDYVFIDCPPSLGLLTVNALAAAGEVFIPIQCEYYALEGVQLLLRNIDLIRRHLNPGLTVSSMLMTMFDGRTRLAADVVAEVRSHFTDVVLQAQIPRSVRISEAPSNAETVMTYDPNSSGGLSYLAAATELAHRQLATKEQP